MYDKTTDFQLLFRYYGFVYFVVVAVDDWHKKWNYER